MDDEEATAAVSTKAPRKLDSGEEVDAVALGHSEFGGILGR
jgi:hypothetical protein